MSIRKISFASSEYYHIYNRGNSKQIIFRDKKDYERFIKLLFISNGEENFKIQFVRKNNIYDTERGKTLVGIGAYCLMPNHFHLIITQTENGSISKFMQKLTTAYSMYYNKKYHRTGTLFEGKFKSEHANKDQYLKYLFSYIHLNPIKIIDSKWKEDGIKDKQKAIDFLRNYKYSSYQDYLKDNREERLILNTEMFPNYFPNQKSFEKEIFEWLTYRQDL